MSNRYKITDPHGIHFITLTVVGWIDIFSRKKYRDMIIENLKYCQENKGLLVHAYVIMTNHIHLVVSSNEQSKLTDILRDFKSYTAKSILNDIPKNKLESRKGWLMYLFGYFAKKNRRDYEHQFWQSDNHPIELTSTKFIRQKIDYIHNNPVRAGWVSYPQHYIYNSASNYFEDGNGILKVSILDQFYPLP